MSSLIRRAVTTSSPLRSMHCTRIMSPIIMQSIVASSRRNYAAHQAEESYDTFNERCVFLTAPKAFSFFLLWFNWLIMIGTGTRNSFTVQTTSSKFNEDWIMSLPTISFHPSRFVKLLYELVVEVTFAPSPDLRKYFSSAFLLFYLNRSVTDL